MKSITAILFTTALCLFGQFRDTEYSDPRVKLLSPSSSGSIFNMSDISVSHTFSSSYISYGSESFMLNEYIAGIKYRISDPLTLRLNLGMSYTPFSSLSAPGSEQTDIYLKSATLDYKPNDKFRMVIDFRNIKPEDMYFNNDPFHRYDFIKEDE